MILKNSVPPSCKTHRMYVTKISRSVFRRRVTER